MSTSASETTTAPTTQQAPDSMATALRQAANQVDHGLEATDDAILQASAEEKEGQPAGGKPGKNSNKKTSDSKDKGADTDPAGDTGDGKDGTDDKSKDKDSKKPDDKTKGEQKQDSPEEKARKENERRERSWTEFNRKQEEFKQQRAELERRERELAERERRASAGVTERRSGPVKDASGYTAEQYEKAAAEWDKAGNYEIADLAKEAAKKLRDQEQAAAQRGTGGDRGSEQRHSAPPEQTPGTPEFKDKWNGHLSELKESDEYKDLGNKESELFKATAGILHQEPRLSMFNDGIRIAAEIASMRIRAGSASALETKLKEANTELEKLRKATTPGSGGGDSRGAASKPFEEMNDAERAVHLKRAAAEVDG
jgi:hypothetical protein